MALKKKTKKNFVAFLKAECCQCWETTQKLVEYLEDKTDTNESLLGAQPNVSGGGRGKTK